MLDRIIVNAVYLVPLRVNTFKKQHPDEEVLIADATKARKAASNDKARHELGWITARRGILMLTAKNLRCGDWIIPLSSIQEATLLHVFGGSVLKVSTSDNSHYQFGLQRNPAWERQTLFPCKIEHGALKFSKGALALRLLVLACMLYLAVQYYNRSGFSIAFAFILIIIVWLVAPFLQLLTFPKAP